MQIAKDIITILHLPEIAGPCMFLIIYLLFRFRRQAWERALRGEKD